MPSSERLVFRGADGISLVAEARGLPMLGEVLFAHGAGQTRSAWAKAARRIASAGWRTIAFDLRGHGESDWSPGGDYRLTRFAEDIVAVAGQMETRPALVGASLGGLAGLLAETLVAPGAFRSLTLVDIVPRMDSAGVSKVMDFMSAHLSDGFADLNEAAEVVGRYLPHRPRSSNLAGLAKNLKQHADGRYRWHWDPRFVASVMQSRDDHTMDELEASARTLTLPVHLIRGQLSELVPLEAARAFVDMVPNAVFTDVANAGHMVAGDRNDLFADAVLGFLEGGAHASG